ncbi:MAG: DUF1365 domain-containing protein [Gammaproteobacteria bacterium]|jgi:DUF1365 family protein
MPHVGEPLLYHSSVMHRRHDKHAMRFEYRIFRMLLDIDNLEKSASGMRLFSIDRWNLFSFRRRDHGPRDGSALRPWAEALLQAHDIDSGGGKILLLAMPRLFGYAFNPLSIWYCLDEADQLRAVICEVRNTFGDYHTYVLHGHDAEASYLEESAPKSFHVSPFMEISGEYRFRISMPRDDYLLHIDYVDDAQRLLTAVEKGRRKKFSDRGLLGILAVMPFVTFKVMAAIHWQAVKLWLHGAKIYPHPDRSRNETGK